MRLIYCIPPHALELPFACELNSVYVQQKECQRESAKEMVNDKYLYDIL